MHGEEVRNMCPGRETVVCTWGSREMEERGSTCGKGGRRCGAFGLGGRLWYVRGDQGRWRRGVAHVEREGGVEHLAWEGDCGMYVGIKREGGEE